MKLGLREANQQFSKAIKAVRAGKEVVLTERGQPIAVITPIKKKDALNVALQAIGSRESSIPSGLTSSHARVIVLQRCRW